jgi:hypothetical protein
VVEEERPHPLRAGERVLSWTLFGSMALTLAGWALHAVGLLPDVLRLFEIPVLGTGAAAGVMLGAAPIIRDAAGPGPLRWTRVALAMGATVLVIGQAGVLLRAWDSGPLAAALVSGSALLGCALLTDGWLAYRRRTLPPLGIAGAFVAAAGVLGFYAGLALPGRVGQGILLGSMGLMAFAGFAFFRVGSHLGLRTIPETPEKPEFPRSFPRRKRAP